MDHSTSDIIESCRQVLLKNWRETHTIPAEGLYPHQWLWDSCFIVIGMRHYDVEQAQIEIKNILSAQWHNGMVPHMLFGAKDKSSRDRKIWQSWRSPHAPEHLDTSGLTQPPMLAEAIVAIGEKLSPHARRSWYLDVLPGLIKYHQWIYTERDPHQEGLALLIHPWESGLDNSPPWITQLHTHGKPLWVSIIEKLKLDRLLLLLRRDTKHVPPGQRLSNIDALLYYSVAQRLRRKNWDIEAILGRSHFAVEDLAFNAILQRANTHLHTIAKSVRHTLPEELELQIERSKIAFEKLWHAPTATYYSRNFVTHSLLVEPTITSLLPLYAGTITQERAEELVAALHDTRRYKSKYPVSSVPLLSPWYKELGYWQGPTWINTNWLIIDGLRRYGFEAEAKSLTDATIELVVNNGPYEYFSSKNGTPAGAKNFSWTAALTIDLLQSRSTQN